MNDSPTEAAMRSSAAAGDEYRTDLAVHRYGGPDAPTVVLVHGLTEAGTAWPDLVARWGDRFDIAAPDLRGHGVSPRFTDAQLAAAPDTLLADVVGLVVALAEARRRPIGVVGHSLGGLLALRAAVTRPDAVAALVLEDPAQPDGATTPDPGFVADQVAFLDDVTGDRVGRLEEMRRETTWTEPELIAWADCKPLVDRRYIRRGLYLGGDPTWVAELRGLRTPTLIVVPEEAPMAPAPQVTSSAPVRTEVVPGAGHCVRRDRPDAYHAVVDAFLADHLA